MNTEQLDKFIKDHKFGDMDEKALRMIVEAAFWDGKLAAVEECKKIINGEPA